VFLSRRDVERSAHREEGGRSCSLDNPALRVLQGVTHGVDPGAFGGGKLQGCRLALICAQRKVLPFGHHHAPIGFPHFEEHSIGSGPG
jgi:hypothetical protein